MADSYKEPGLVFRGRHRGREFIRWSDGGTFSRKIGSRDEAPSAWTVIDTPLPRISRRRPTLLSVVIEDQAGDEPEHWSLFAHRPNATGTGKGHLWEVSGDTEHMHYQHAYVDILDSRALASQQVLNGDLTNSQLARIDQIAREEPPPHAADRTAVTENSQGWVIRVLRRLADEGIVAQSAVNMVQEEMDTTYAGPKCHRNGTSVSRRRDT